MDYSNMTVDECGALANAIVLQAIDDYEKAIAVLATEYHPETLKQEQEWAEKRADALKMKMDCERFFSGEWYKKLTTIESEVITNMILDGIHNAEMVVYNEKKKRYLCTCKYKLPVRAALVPIIKCRNCRKYWRVFGNPIEVE